jgi:DHA2 family multidrug resistance protein-like MFS transporter
MEDALGALPSGTADAARESIDRAVEAASHLPPEQGGELLATARDAFTSGLHVVGIVSAIFYAGLAVLAVRAFRHVRNAEDGGGTTAEARQAGAVPETARATDA